MHKFAVGLALVAGAALALPALAQKKDDPPKKVAIPANTFVKSQLSNQYLARQRLIGAKVVNKDGTAVGDIEDLIVGDGGRIEGVIMGVGGFLGVGEKKVGVRFSALKVTTADGKTTVSLPAATKAVLGTVEAYRRTGAVPKKQ
jgi:sporulation protein YlmC with PRC-barrel domain